jgi:hypothetical protein
MIHDWIGGLLCGQSGQVALLLVDHRLNMSELMAVVVERKDPVSLGRFPLEIFLPILLILLLRDIVVFSS